MTNPLSPFYTQRDKVRISVWVTPKAARSAIGEVEVGADGKASLKVRVTAAPEKGKANRAVVKLLSKQWGLAQRDVTVVSGDTARVKTLEIAGDATPLLRDLGRWLTQRKTGAK